VIFESTNPLTSRLRYESRGVRNIACVAPLFLAFAIVFSWLASILFPGTLAMVFVDVVGLAGAYWLFNFLGSRLIGFDCNHCGKYIASNTPWVCGFCKKSNLNANDYPFVHKCEHCGNEPKAYKCHHAGCGQLVFLTRDMLKINFAYCLNSQTAELPKPDPKAEKKIQQEEALEDIQHQIILEELNGKHADVLKRKEQLKTATPEEKFKRDREKYFKSDDIVREAEKKIREEFKNNPDRLEKELLFLKKWREDNIQ
jgi:hypothetical protein